MSTNTASNLPQASTTSRLSRSSRALAVSAIVVVAAAVALTVWLLTQSPTHHSKLTSPPLSNVQKAGVAGQNGSQLCAPVQHRRFC